MSEIYENDQLMNEENPFQGMTDEEIEEYAAAAGGISTMDLANADTTTVEIANGTKYEGPLIQKKIVFGNNYNSDFFKITFTHNQNKSENFIVAFFTNQRLHSIDSTIYNSDMQTTINNLINKYQNNCCALGITFYEQYMNGMTRTVTIKNNEGTFQAFLGTSTTLTSGEPSSFSSGRGPKVYYNNNNLNSNSTIYCYIFPTQETPNTSETIEIQIDNNCLGSITTRMATITNQSNSFSSVGQDKYNEPTISEGLLLTTESSLVISSEDRVGETNTYQKEVKFKITKKSSNTDDIDGIQIGDTIYYLNDKISITLSATKTQKTISMVTNPTYIVPQNAGETITIDLKTLLFGSSDQEKIKSITGTYGEDTIGDSLEISNKNITLAEIKINSIQFQDGYELDGTLPQKIEITIRWPEQQPGGGNCDCDSRGYITEEKVNEKLAYYFKKQVVSNQDETEIIVPLKQQSFSDFAYVTKDEQILATLDKYNKAFYQIQKDIAELFTALGGAGKLPTKQPVKQQTQTPEEKN